MLKTCTWDVAEVRNPADGGDQGEAAMECGAPAIATGGGGAAVEFALCRQHLDEALKFDPELDYEAIRLATKRILP